MIDGSRREGLRVLVIDRMPPISLRQGNALIGRNVFARLGHHRLVLVCPAGTPGDPGTEADLHDLFGEVHLVESARVPPALGGWVDASLPPPIGDRVAPGLRSVLRRLTREAPFDVVHVRQLPMAPLGSMVAAPGRLLELVDSETLATRRDPRPGVRGAVRRHVAREIERRAMRGYDVVTAVAEADARTLRSIGPAGVPVEVVPNGVDAAVFAPLDLPEDPASLVFVGAMSFPPNIAAVTWFVDAVFPIVRAARPDSTFTIVGRDPSPAVAALAARPGVVVTGEVDDVRPYLARATIAVSPMTSGSGIKNKVLEALAMARPVVATPLAVEGIEAVDGREVAVASGAAGMADAILGLLADTGARAALGSAGRRLVEARYSWDACAARYDALYRELAAGRQPARSPVARRDGAAVRR